jgi:hypothetical protein
MAALEIPAFLPRKLAYLRRLRRYAVSTPANEAAGYVSSLQRDGIVVVPNFLDSDTLQAMRSAMPDLATFEESREGDRGLYYREADRIGEFAPFFDHSIIRAAAQGYISASATLWRGTVAIKTFRGDVLCFDHFSHMDGWKTRLKAFLYLEDVGDANAPMIYLKGSHHGLWRLPMEASLASRFRTDQRGFALAEDYYMGCFWPHEVLRLTETYGFKEMICTGDAGTLVLFDGRGLHRATPLRSGRRLLLASVWVHRGDQI